MSVSSNTVATSAGHVRPTSRVPRFFSVRAAGQGGAKWANLLLGLSFPAALLLAWWITAAAGWLSPQILPAPTLVATSFAELLSTGLLAEHVLASLRRIAVGFAAGAVFGLLFGAAAGLFPTFRAYAYPPIQAIARVSVLAWLPLLALFIGIDEALKYVVIGWSAAVPIIIGTVRGIAETPAALNELGDVYSFTPADRLRLVVLPSALPSIFTGLREGLANSWQTLVIAELFASFEGLGYLMTWGRQLFQLDLVLISMVVVALLGVALDAVFKWLEWRVQPWNRVSEARNG